MAYYQIRCNLVSATFPFFTENWGRTVIVPQQDFNYDRQAAATVADYDKDKGIPQLYYAHNVMPTAQGVMSIGYNVVWAGLPGATDFDSAIPFITSDQNRFVLVPAGGMNYIANAVDGVWVSTSPFPSGAVPADIQVTTAYVQGQTYICYANYGIYVYDETSKTLVVQGIIGIAATDIKAICAAGGYMIAITDVSVHWSDLTNPVSFQPSLETGAGGTQVSDAQGHINFCLSISGGFMIYCEKNVVSATYTANIQYPFTFVAVKGSGAVASTEHVTWQANMGEHYVWGGNGMQKLSRTESVLVYPELTDFLAAKIFEDFNETTLLLSQEYLPDPLYVHTCLVTARFFVVSYGVNYGEYTHAVIYDMALKRWGKVKLLHRDCFEWNFPNLYGDITYEGLGELSYYDLGTTTYSELSSQILNPMPAKAAIAFLQMDGTVQVVDFSVGNANANGVMIAGKYQFIRNSLVKHLDTEVEAIDKDFNFKMYLLPSLDGKTLLPAKTTFPVHKSPLLRTFACKYTALNFSTLFMGSFNLVSFQIKIMQGPNR